MEMNKIIRRTGIPVADAYAKFVADLTDALKDFGSITKEEGKESQNADGTVKEYPHTRFYLFIIFHFVQYCENIIRSDVYHTLPHIKFYQFTE